MCSNARGSFSDEPPASELEARLSDFRGWDDLAIAIGHRDAGAFPVAPYRIVNRARRSQPDFKVFRARLNEAVARSQIAPQQFWRTLPDDPFVGSEVFLARRWDDPGRAAMLAAGFRALGGVAPFLLVWLGILAACLVIALVSAEAVAAGRAVAGVVLVSGFACSAFCVDLLMLGYSAAGFSLLATLLVAGLAIHACLHRSSSRALLARALASGCLFGAFAFARSASLLSLPAVALVFGIAAHRSHPARTWRATFLALVCLLVFVAPYGVMRLSGERRLDAAMRQLKLQRRPQQLHDVWLGIWEGLGDFDRSKGHVFLDYAAELEAKRHGLPRRLTRGTEELFRGLVLEDIRSDPAWYASILARRAWSIFALEKLWPFGPRDGRSFAPATHPAEGAADNYWTMTHGADFFRLGRVTVEAPTTLLLLPLLGLLAVGLVATAPLRDEARRGLGVVACVAAAALPAPVIGSTASAFETESFVVVHFSAAAFLAQAGWDALRLRRAATARAGSRP